MESNACCLLSLNMYENASSVGSKRLSNDLLSRATALSDFHQDSSLWIRPFSKFADWLPIAFRGAMWAASHLPPSRNRCIQAQYASQTCGQQVTAWTTNLEAGSHCRFMVTPDNLNNSASDGACSIVVANCIILVRRSCKSLVQAVIWGTARYHVYVAWFACLQVPGVTNATLLHTRQPCMLTMEYSETAFYILYYCTQ